MNMELSDGGMLSDNEAPEHDRSGLRCERYTSLWVAFLYWMPSATPRLVLSVGCARKSGLSVSVVCCISAQPLRYTNGKTILTER